MKAILIPTDFSVCAQNAANYACELALAQNTSLTLFHCAYIHYSEAGTLLDFSDQVKEVSLEYLAEEVLRLYKKYPAMKNLGIETLYKIGDLDLEVRELEKTNQFYLIVMGTKGRSGWEELLLGSETARLVGAAHLPLLAVPANASYQKAKKVMYAANFEEQLNSSDLELLNQFISPKAKLHLYHNYSDFTDIEVKKEEALLAEFHAHFKNYIDLQLEFNSTDTSSIEEYANLLQAELLIVRKKQGSFWKELFKISVSKGLSYHSKMPLLVLR